MEAGDRSGPAATSPDGAEAGTGETASEQETLRELALGLLEFSRIRQMLAAKARFFLSSERALHLEPAADLDDVVRMQEETAEADLMLSTVGDIGLAGADDPRLLLRRAALGGALQGSELLKLVYLFESMWLARRVVESMHDRTPRLRQIAARVPDLRDVKPQVLDAIDERGEVKDEATPRLGPLRANAATAYNRLLRLLERIAGGTDVRGALQSTAIAARGDRLVLEVKSEFRRVLPGIVHDVSGTGMTLFVEPFQAVDRCNEWRELAAEAVREEERVLRRLSKVVGDREPQALEALEAAGELDLIAAKARLAHSMKATRVETLPSGSDESVRLISARHPLLGEGAVPVNVRIGPGFRALVVTGPNTGGKTVALKTIGILSLMHQAGLQLPAADGSALAVFDGVYADIGDAQSIERSVSTFSSHMGNVIRVLRHVTPSSLVLLDELGTGTDPEEGSALARAVLSHLVSKGVTCAITTHHRSVAEYAGASPGMQNASVELDPETMLPTYHVLMGVPGRSYAMHVASRLGLSQEILSHARTFIDPQRHEAENLLNEIQKERDALRKAGVAAQKDRAEAETARRELQSRLASIRKQQEDLIERTRMELRREAEEVRHDLRKIADETRVSANVAEARASVNRVRQALSEPTWFPLDSEASDPVADGEGQDAVERSVQAGDTVEVKGLNVQAQVLAVREDGTTDLQMGGVKVQLNTRQLRLVHGAIADAPSGPPVSFKYAGPLEPVSQDLDIRGTRAGEAYELVTAFIDKCAAAGLQRCRVIHGTGTGALREAVREVLASSRQVASFATAPQHMGGNGVTQIELA